MLSKELLEILACPACDSRPPVRANEDETELVCTECGRRYPVREGIPVMLVDEALPPAPSAVEKP
jgi:uncharacterized protein YbaR (Trm112 family)